MPRNYQEAVRLFRLAAEQGHSGGQFSLGSVYENGWGLARDYHEATKWYRLVADQSHARAQYFLGAAYSMGRGVAQDHAEAARWFRLAGDPSIPEFRTLHRWRQGKRTFRW